MELTEDVYAKILELLPRQRGNVSLSNRDVLNAMLHVMEKRCQWRALPEEFGNWNSIYVRVSRWEKKGVLAKIFTLLQKEGLLRISIEIAEMKSFILQKRRSRQPKFVWLPLLPRAAGECAGGRSCPELPANAPGTALPPATNGRPLRGRGSGRGSGKNSPESRKRVSVEK